MAGRLNTEALRLLHRYISACTEKRSTHKRTYVDMNIYIYIHECVYNLQDTLSEPHVISYVEGFLS